MQHADARIDLEQIGGRARSRLVTLDGDEPAKQAIHEQDLAIAEKSGLPALEIKSIKRSGAK